ncbi:MULTISPECIES: cytochrome c1 [Ignatzschineria]|uniref:Cytochrome C n=2 Tax=Ignatzschineria TaxID=112008 RepID=A0A2U2AKT8_9GAMM|nr:MULTISPECIES: cytochrome c1 [Ignatzschineria]MDM1545628.1 cytochrome c1 [Ignatzschineria indica]PWD83693.1 cytochrome C [Ignatzschineria cameli]PWD85575.1 cytochrome C [Ignatzschineria indica]PWD88732.1 cytochrome C [Ignatzschineria cameli]PWD89686.1 cytochrome C [Ignatzschineria cameli]
MRKIITLFTSCLFFMAASANAQTSEDLTAKALDQLGDPQINVTNYESLQSGARLYMDYCLACHSLEFQRYNITARDIGLQEEDIQKLINTGSYDPREAEFIATKDGDLIYTAMDRGDAQIWLGVAPPDLSTIARAKGPDYIFKYLLSFYEDESRPTGMNNIAFPNAGMPHVLAELQGTNRPIVEKVAIGECDLSQPDECQYEEVVVGLEKVTDGAMTELEFRKSVNDLTNFLTYVAEPAQLERKKYGPWVLGFLVIFTILAYALNREYWKDVK